MELFEAKAKITALRDQLNSFASEYKKDVLANHLGLPPERIYRNADPAKVMHIFERFSVLLKELKLTHPQLFADMPERPIPDPTAEGAGAFSGRGAVVPGTTELWVSDMDYCLQMIKSVEERPPTSIKVTNEGVYFAGEQFDALQRFQEIISNAKQTVTIIDGYVSDKVLNLLTNKRPNVQVQILTFTVSPALSTAAQVFNSQYQGLQIRTSRHFHDRFVIVDDSEFYHFGASIKDLGSKGFMFSKIEEPSVVSALRTKIASEWAGATVVI